MPRNSGPRGEYAKRHNCWCMWCGEPFESSHDDAKTCGMKCRSRMFRYVHKTGFEPDEPVGNVTAEVAYQETVLKLLVEERDRRRLIRAMVTGGAAGMFAAAAEQIAAKKATAKKTG